MTSLAPSVVILSQNNNISWPPIRSGVDHPKFFPCTPLGYALTTRHRCDAHTAGYGAPDDATMPRLNKGALGQIALEMQVLFIDIDAPAAHASSGGVSGADIGGWRADLEPKIARLLAAHPGAFGYETKNGARLVYRVEGHPICTPEDVAAWERYVRGSFAYIKRTFDLDLDPCSDEWWRLFRLPFVVRDGVAQDPGTYGDPHDVALWTYQPTADDLQAVGPVEVKRRRHVATEELDLVEDPLLDLAIERGLAGVFDARKLWAICPNADEHSKDTDGTDSTIIFRDTGTFTCAHSHCKELGINRDVFNASVHGLEWRSPDWDSLCAKMRGARRTTRPSVEVPAVPTYERPMKKRAVVMGPDLHRVVDEAAASLVDHPGMYQRGGELVRVVALGDEKSNAPTTAGTLQIRAFGEATLKSEMTRCADYFALRKDTPTLALPTPDVVRALHARGSWAVPAIAGIVESPSMRPDGTILQAPGYDPVTGFFYAPGATVFPHIPDAPTLDDARRSLAALYEVFDDFPHRAKSDRSVAVAAILTLLARPAITGNVPCFIFDASTPGSGKTLQADIVSTIATGRLISKVTFPPADDELEKILGGYARKAVSLFAFDNIAADIPFGGAPLDKVLTCGGPVDLRILGKSEVPTFQWFAVIVATGNNVGFRGDTFRRTLISRLEPNVENPENRQDAKHPERWGEHRLLPWVQANRPRLVTAGLTVLRAYVAAGTPPVPGWQLWGSFGAWSSLIARSIIWAGGTDPQLSRPDPEDAADPAKDAMRTIFATWPQPKGAPITIGELLAAKFTDLDFKAAIDTLVPPRPGVDQRAGLGRVFKKWVDRVVDGQKIEAGKNSDKKVRTWRVV